MKLAISPLSLLVLTLPAAAGLTLTPLASFGGGDGWRAPGEVLAGDAAGTNNGTAYNYLGTGNFERGLAYNGSADKLILLSRNGGINIRQLDPLTGVDVAAVATGTGVIFGGIFTASMIACDSSGALYAANLTTNATTGPFKVYRWAGLGDAAPEVYFESTITGFTGDARLGDSFDLTDSPNGPVLVAGCGTGVTGYAAISGSPASAAAVASFNPAGPGPGDFRLGITFAGAANEVWGRQTSGSGRRTTFAGSAGAALGDLPGITGSQAAMDYAVVDGLPLLAVLNMANSTVSVYDVTNPAQPVLAASGTATSGTLSGNSNAVGSIKWGAITGGSAKLYAMSTNQGLQAFSITVTPDLVAPAIATSPAARTVYERGLTTFTVTATGSPPLSYQWLRDNNPIDGATSPGLTVNPVNSGSAGDYVCRVTNTAGSAESTPATLTVAPGVNTAGMTVNWALAPLARPWLSSGGDTERGITCNPATNRVYVASRNPTAQIHVLDGATGADIGPLNMSGVSGGTFALMFPGVTGDGVLYACNLSNTGDGGSFKIYQWPDDGPLTAPFTAYEGNPVGSRIGDSFAVRSGAAGAECLAGARNTNQVVLFRDSGGGFLFPSIITVADAPNGSFGLGVAFGEGDTFWGHGDGGALYYCSYDADAGTGSVIATYGPADGVPAASVNPLGVDPVNRCLAMVDTGNSDNVRFYSYSADPVPVLTLLDQEFFLTDNPNGNRVGSVFVGAGKVCALSTNNGILCASTLKPAPPVLGAIALQPNGTLTVEVSGTPGFHYVMEESPDLAPTPWNPVATLLFAQPVTTFTVPVTGARDFFRVRLGP